MGRGVNSFGLVTIPVKVVSATEDHDVHFHRVHPADMGRVRTRKVCELDDQVVSQDEIDQAPQLGRPGVRSAGTRCRPRRFAHHSGPDGRPHVCGRRARSVNSADRLSAKSAAAAWLPGSGTRADIDFVPAGGSPPGRLEY